jgi:hypothetical protein
MFTRFAVVLVFNKKPLYKIYKKLNMKESSVTILLGLVFIILAALVGSWKQESYT